MSSFSLSPAHNASPEIDYSGVKPITKDVMRAGHSLFPEMKSQYAPGSASLASSGPYAGQPPEPDFAHKFSNGLNGVGGGRVNGDGSGGFNQGLADGEEWHWYCSKCTTYVGITSLHASCWNCQHQRCSECTLEARKT